MMCAAVVPGVAAQHTWAASCSACCPTGPRACEPCSTCCSTTTAGPASLCATQPSTPLSPPPWLLPPPRRGRPRPRASPRRSRRSSELARMATGSSRSSEGGRPSRARRARSRMRSDCCRCGATPSVGLHSGLDADIEQRRGCRLVICVDGRRLQRGSRLPERARAMHSNFCPPSQ